MEIEKIVKNIDICGEALSFADFLLERGQESEANSLLRDTQLLAAKMLKQLEGINVSSKYIKQSILCCKNMGASFERFFSVPENRYCIVKYELPMSFFALQKFLEWEIEFSKDFARIQKHRCSLVQDMRLLHDSRHLKANKYKYKVSIFLRAYNKLDYTKIAIESILKYTDFSSGDIELITLNNGSSDGTEAYFNSLLHEKKLNLKYNMLSAPIPAHIYEGEYTVYFSNDAVATPHWLEQLIECIESSENIAVVTPTCNEDSISAQQGTRVSYTNHVSSMDAMEKFAEKYNHSNPLLWEDRSILMPFVSVALTDMMSLPMLDMSYDKDFFGDDDFSTLLRRTGWRQVLAKDTFLHHFGSVTLGDNKAVYRDDMNEMRRVYFDKWGVDAWESRGILGIEHTFQWISHKKGSRILWIEPKFGADFLLMKNFYRKNGCDDVTVDAMVVDSRYLPDAKYYFDRCISAEDLLQAVSEVQEGYDLIAMSACLHEVVDGSAIALLEKLYGILKPGGQLLVPVKNWNSASCLKEIIISGGVHPWGCPANTFKGLSMWGLLGELARHEFLKKYSRAVITGIDRKLSKDMHSKLVKIFSDVCDSDDLETILKIDMVWLGFEKN